MKTETLIPHIRSASRQLVREFGLLDNRFAAIGSVSQCHALMELDAHGVMNLGQLSAMLNLEKSTTSRLVTQMLEKEICRIQADKNDRRNKLISLTKKGCALANKIHVEAKLQVEQALEIMTEDEKHMVVRGLSIYAKALKRSRLQSAYTIRKLHKNDVPQLITVIRSVWEEFGFDSNHPQAGHFEAELNQTYEIFTMKRSNYFVLVHDGKIVGGVGYAPIPSIDKDTCEGKGMYLPSEFRGLGLSELLVKKALQEAKKAGFNKCYIETMDFMQAANALYKKSGFRQLEKPMGNTGHTWTKCWYIKEL